MSFTVYDPKMTLLRISISYKIIIIFCASEQIFLVSEVITNSKTLSLVWGCLGLKISHSVRHPHLWPPFNSWKNLTIELFGLLVFYFTYDTNL